MSGMGGSHITLRVGASVLLGVALLARPAHPCSYAKPPPVEPDPSRMGVDVTPPELLKATVWELTRGIVPTAADVMAGCLTRSYFWIVPHALDDQTPSDKLAYRVEALRGNPPIPYDEPMSYMYFIWEEDPAEPIDFELRVRAVDEAGNESNPIDVRVTEPVNVSGGGCDLLPAGRGRHFSWASLLPAVAWSLRRRLRA